MSQLTIFHHDDADGRCAAAIMLAWGELRYAAKVATHACNYKDGPDFKMVSLGSCVAIVDFSFPPPVMAELQAITGDIIWCDHHATARDYKYDLKGYRDFSEKGLCGAECTWKYCFPDRPIPLAVRLLGDYDSWRLENAPKTFQFYEGLKLHNWPPYAQEWAGLFSLHGPAKVCEIVGDGTIAIAYRNTYCADMCRAFGYETEIDGHRAFAANLYRFGSPGFGGRFHDYPVCLAYIHDGTKFTVSLYSETVDVSDIAKHHGGGGHKGAAGFVCDRLPFAVKDT